MIVESMAAFALVKGAVDAVKSAIDTADDVKGIYSGLDSLFKHRDAVANEVKKNKQAKPRSKMSLLFNRKTNEDTEDDLSVGNVAAMVLEQKKIDRDIKNLGIRIDNKFGPGTWEEIIETRDKMIIERNIEREKQKQAAKERIKEENAFWDKVGDIFVEIGKVILVLIVFGIVCYVIWINRAGAEPLISLTPNNIVFYYK
tara:strand:+ start:350 stop:949 length:600 start_codon:yes stop_codon:yes gene_type:complete